MAKPETQRSRRRVPEAVRRIPRFKTVQEEAEFWDAHSTADFESEFDEVKDVKFVVRRLPVDRPLTVRVDQETYASLSEEAQAQGVGPTTLVRMWIMDRIRKMKRDRRRIVS